MPRRVHRSRHLPTDHGACGWLETIPRDANKEPLRGGRSADCVIVGAGFTGLAAARRLAELQPDWRIAVVDARGIGEGASGRSSGFVVDLTQYVQAMPEDEGERFLRLQRAGITELRRMVDVHQIDCDWDERGWFHGAASAEALQSLEARRDWLGGRGERFEWLDTEAIAAITGSQFYRAGIRLPGSVLVQAGALVRGLARCLPSTVSIFENSPIHRISEGTPHTVSTAEGSITAPSLIVAVNAYAPNLGFLRNRIFPLTTFGSLSRPLTAPEQEAVGGEREWGLLAQESMGSTVRRTRDQRILIRNTVHYDATGRTKASIQRKITELHRRALAVRFPALAELQLPYMWAGAMGVAGNQNLFFGELGSNIVGVAGYRGAGIALGTTCGMLAADVVGESDSDLLEDVRALPGPCWIPPQPFLGIGIRWRTRRMNRSAGPLS